MRIYFVLKCKFFLIPFLLFFVLAFSEEKPPELTPKIVKKKMEEIFGSHVSYTEMTKELGKRVLENFIKELDPIKTYLIRDEIAKYIDPSEGVIEELIQGYKRGDFSLFRDIYQIMLRAILRRERIEEKIVWEKGTEEVKGDSFHDLDWAADKKELKHRLRSLRALQLKTANELKWDDEERFLKLIKKRRLRKERRIRQTHPEEQEKQMLAFFLKAFTSALDNHTVYFTPLEANQFKVQLQQSLSGIGAQLQDDLDGLNIVHLLEGGPAAKSGDFRIGDCIVAVDREPIAGMDINEAVEKIRGKKGTVVTLTILRELEGKKKRQKIEISLERDEIALNESRFSVDSIPYGNGVIGHLRLFSFYQSEAYSSAEDLKKAIEELTEKHKVLGMILDLRGNAGGVLPQAVEVSGLFIQKGIVVSVKDNRGALRHLRNFNGDPIWKGPLIILTDKGTASCGEIVAQTLQDYKRAILVGDQMTWGKGSYQSFTLDVSQDPIQVNPSGEYKVTRGLYYTVSGNSPQLSGTKVDIEVPGPLFAIEVGEAEAKFPLKGDVIAPNFQDRLLDIHPFYRRKMKKLYNENRQKAVDLYHRHLPILKKNSKERIKENRNYQNFLKEFRKKKFNPDQIERYGQNDLQLEEAYNIMKDLIWMIQVNSRVK